MTATITYLDDQTLPIGARGVAIAVGQVGFSMSCGGLFSKQQRTKSWMTGLVSAAGGQATPTWLGLTPVTGR
jgi:hypothetical protein